MLPMLHHSYTVDEAIAVFADAATPETLCDGQFVVTSKAVLCLTTVGDPATEPHVSCPSCVVWKPHRLDYDPSDEFPWLPEQVREVNRQRVKEHHLFIRSPGDARLLYAGKAHLGSYGDAFGEGKQGKEACFDLSTKLPRNEWLRFGGYSGWLVEVDHHSHRVDQDDFTAFEKLVDELMQSEFSHLNMTRYEEDSLSVHTNANRGWLMYLRNPGDTGLYVRDLNYVGDSKAEEHFMCGCGIDLDFPADQTLSRKAAINVAVEFCRFGQLPQSVHWEEEE